MIINIHKSQIQKQIINKPEGGKTNHQFIRYLLGQKEFFNQFKGICFHCLLTVYAVVVYEKNIKDCWEEAGLHLS